MNQSRENLRGTKHLRVGVEIRHASLRVVSLWVVDHPVIQRARLTKPLLARIDLADRLVLLEAFDDPRITRGTFKEGAGHSFIVEDTGIIYVAVPFSEANELSNVRLGLIDTSKAKLTSSNVTYLIETLDKSRRSLRRLGEIRTKELMAHKDWPEVAGQLGMPYEPGRIEIFVDRKGKYRWRLRRSTGEIVATSHQGFSDRSACEADLVWIRANVTSATVVPLDLPS